MMATRYHVVAASRSRGSCGHSSEFQSFQALERSVTASATTDVAAFGSANPPAVPEALKSPWMYTGFSDVMVSPGMTMLPSDPFISLRARRNRIARLVRATAPEIKVVGPDPDLARQAGDRAAGTATDRRRDEVGGRDGSATIDR